MDKTLICSDCGLVVDLPSREGKTCGKRLAGGQYCNGTIQASVVVPKIDEKLICTECERVADNMAFEGQKCGFRFGLGQYCQGIMKRGVPQV
jgi:hypothetical protein